MGLPKSVWDAIDKAFADDEERQARRDLGLPPLDG
jgi:hypothetical protein